MKLCIPFRVARVSITADLHGNKSASVMLVPKPSEFQHDVAAALWGRYGPNGELLLHNINPSMVDQMEAGMACNVIIEVLT